VTAPGDDVATFGQAVSHAAFTLPTAVPAFHGAGGPLAVQGGTDGENMPDLDGSHRDARAGGYRAECLGGPAPGLGGAGGESDLRRHAHHHERREPGQPT